MKRPTLANSMEDYQTFITHLAKEAGAIISSQFTAKTPYHIKEDGSFVTEVDTAVQDMVIQKISRAFPNDTIISEEREGIVERKSSRAWVCDPLDGTAMHARGIPTCAFSLALTEHGKPIAGAVYNPLQEHLLYAESKKGSTLNSVPITVSTRSELHDAMVGMSLWHGSKYQCLPVLGALYEHKVLPFNAFSIVYMGSLVAAGHMDAVIYLDPYAHDVAALKIIVEEAGGKVTDLWGNDQLYDRDVKGALISNGILHEQLLELTKKILPR